MSYSGLAIVEHVGRVVAAGGLGPARGAESWTVQGAVKDADAGVACVKRAAEVPPEDVKYRDTTMGDDAELGECTVTEKVFFDAGDPRAFEVLTNEPLQPGPQGRVVLSLFCLTPEGELVAIECRTEQGCVGFFGAGFASFIALFPIESSVAGAVWTFSRVPLTVEGINIVLEVPVAETVTGDPVGGPAALTEATLYISNGEFESITRLSLDAIRKVSSK